MRIAFAIVSVGTAFNFPLLIFQSATYARQRFDIATGIAIAERLVGAALYVLVLELGYGLVGVAIVNIAVTTAANLVRTRIAYALLPGLRLTLASFRRESVRELYGYSVFSVLINAADQVLVHSASLVLGIVMSATAVAHYNAGALPVSYFIGLVSTIAWTLTPLATARDSLGDVATVRSLWLSGSRMILTFASVIAGGIVLMGQDFLALWMEPEYSNGVEFPSSAWVAGILAVVGLVRASTTTGRQICFGMREVRFLARISFVEAGLNLVLCTVLGLAHGIVGVAIGTLIATSAIQLVAMPRFLSRRLGVPLVDFFSTVPWAPLAVLLAMAATHWLVRDAILVTNWAVFALKAVVLASPGAMLGFWIGTTRDEKARLRAQLQRLAPGRRSA
jgi:O-antigen/teichoic acid export membrane protein